MSERNSSFGDFLSGILVGGVIGYVVAMLNAPRTGEETRQMLNERSRELRDRAVETAQMTRDKTEKLVAEGRTRVEERVSELKDRGQTVVADVRSQVSEKLQTTAEKIEPTETSTTDFGSQV